MEVTRELTPIPDVIKMRGMIELELRDVAGRVVQREQHHNVVITAGRRWVLQQIESSDIVTSQSISYMAIGTGTTAPATSDSALVSEVSRKAIQSFTTSNLTSNPPSWRAECSWATNEGNTTLGEACLANSSSGGTLLNRVTFATVNKTTSNTLAISLTISN